MSAADAIEIVDPGFLRAWGLTLDESDESAADDANTLDTAAAEAPASPFPQDDQLNRKLVLWHGDLLALKVECIVSCNNERLTSTEGVTGDIVRRCGSALRDYFHAECGQDGCRTGDAMRSPSFGRLPAPHLMHVIAPRYTQQYHDAAVYALHSCVKRAFEVAKENDIHEIAFSVLHTESKKFPAGLAIGICLRTIRRMLEHYRAWFYRVVICTQDEQQLREYQDTVPVYFPRSLAEARRVVALLPAEVGNKFGEPVRQGRESSFIGLVGRQPGGASASASASSTSSAPLPSRSNSSNAGSASQAGVHAASSSSSSSPRRTRVNDIGVFSDFRDKEADEGKAAGAGTEEEAAEVAARRAYRTCIEQARTMDLSRLEQSNFIYAAGKDKRGRTIVVIVGARIPRFCYDRAFYHLCSFLDSIEATDEPYVVVYAHTNFESDNQPEFEWLKSCYKLLPNAVKDNMKRIYLVHPTYWLRFCFWWATSFVSESFWPKLVYVESLYGEMDGIDFAVEQLKLPDFVFEYDAYYHGAPLKTATAATAAGASSHRE